MEQKKDVCPYCNGTDTIICDQVGHAQIRKNRPILASFKPLYHVVCLDCGTVIRSYIKNPQDWAK